ncbi:mechanosensitive ion channel family protein [Paraburkholderia phymatum]|uniref:Small-conductance mechanosensitive channel n=1 Tax=Paraburkholderia phymatum (strain DSM 17167 / CIP 108236 / LMG 21445 / STM815) TaxID=391038 RepID=B2JR05_PARP8|nr:mechanosensitive ion channel family protein [Paraburkholderia phymatum]ACC73696.1 MscS Mechanosensitive ion channel [Paraburkholderia phymatum STM815]
MSLKIPILLLLLMMLASPFRAARAEVRPESPVLLESVLETAPVEIDGQLLFMVRGVTSFPAEQRAEAIRGRIEKVAADRVFPSDGLSAEPVGNVTMIMARQVTLMIVSEADAQLEHTSRDHLATLHMMRIRQAIDEYRQSRTSDALLSAGLFSTAATAVLALVIAALLALNRWLDRALSRRLQSRVHAVGIQSFQILGSETIWKALHGLVLLLGVATIAVSAYAYLHYVLALFPWTRSVSNDLFDLAVNAAERIGKSVGARIPDILVLASIYYLCRFVLRLTRHFFDAVAQKRVRFAQFEPEWALPTYRLIRVLILAFALIIAYPYIPGSESAAFKGVSIFIGLVFSLGSSAAISNLIAGYLMTYRRVFKVGDRVKVGDVTGDVIAIRLQVTHLRTIKNEEVTIPNSQILNGDVTNFSSLAVTPGLILHTTVGIGYETPWRQVEAMLRMAAKRTTGIAGDPQPFILLIALGDFAVTYELNGYIHDPHAIAQIHAELHRHILDVFNEYGVQIMTPAYERDPPEPKVVRQEQWYAAPASSVQRAEERAEAANAEEGASPTTLAVQRSTVYRTE